MLSAEWAEETEDTLELLTKPNAARRPAGRRLELKPGGRRPDWLALGCRDLEGAAWGWAAAGAGAGAGAGAWWVNTWSSVGKAQLRIMVVIHYRKKKVVEITYTLALYSS